MRELNNDIEEAMVLVYDAPDQTTAEVVCATLQSAGIGAVLQHQYYGPATGMLTFFIPTTNHGVLAPASQAEAAREVMAAREPTDAELEAEFEADTTTIEEAEGRVK